MLYHFSEDPAIERFVPHVPKTNPTQLPAVWAIDEDHAPLYWFPRDCPRVAAWPRNDTERARFELAFATSARHVHTIELGWVERMRSTAVYRYEMPLGPFVPWEAASGQWVAHHAVEPISVEPLGDLLALHEAARIELRLVPTLWPLIDLAVSAEWDFSIVRKANASTR